MAMNETYNDSITDGNHVPVVIGSVALSFEPLCKLNDE